MTTPLITHGTHRGQREYQEDRYDIIQAPEGWLIGVFDGHGGAETSQYCKENLIKAFEVAGEDETLPLPTDKLRGMFKYLARQTKRNYDGSTAAVVFIPSDLSRAYVGILGDSPVIIKTSSGEFWHSPEHNVRSNPSEVERVKAAGGTVYSGYMFAPGSGFAANGLQLSRAFGDKEFDVILSREPEIFEVQLGSNSFVLVGTDGLFDPHHSSSTTAETITSLVEKTATASDLVKFASQIAPTGDNVTAVLLRVP